MFEMFLYFFDKDTSRLTSERTDKRSEKVIFLGLKQIHLLLQLTEANWLTN